jgi:hypothetical protein
VTCRPLPIHIKPIAETAAIRLARLEEMKEPSDLIGRAAA